jgi:hypothetical protein
MCLATFQKEPYIAQKDIIVYKALFKSGKRILSPFREFPYILKKLYQTDFGITFSLTYNAPKLIHEGFHGYRNRKYAISRWIKVYKCIIPKGSQYYISSDQKEIVSDQIIIKRKLWFNRF